MSARTTRRPRRGRLLVVAGVMVAALTLAHRLFAVCYPTLAIAVVESVAGNVHARAGAKAKGTRLNRISSVALPCCLVVAALVVVLPSLAQRDG